MHQCIGNNDYENKKIYEESVRPEGIRKMVKFKETTSLFEMRPNNNVQRDYTQVQNNFTQAKREFRQIANRKGMPKNIHTAEVVVTIITIFMFISFFFTFLGIMFGF